MRIAQEKERKNKPPIGLFILLFIAVALILATLYAINIMNKLQHEELDGNDLGITSSFEDNPTDTSITNIALFGVDQRDDQTQVRSDAIMILTVDKQHNKIKLSSLMRDMAVEIDERGQDKINAAFFYGGPQLAVKTINQNFGLNISEYGTVNFQQMATIVDAVGGVEIDITEAERLDANNSIYEQSAVAGLPQDIIKEAGLQTLSGTQAVAYARIRHVENQDGKNDDFGRTDRQREVLSKMFYKALDMNPLQYPEFARKLLPAVVTSLDFGEILDLGTIMLRPVEFEDVRFPMDSDLIGNGVVFIGKQQCLNVDLESTSKKLYDFIYNDINPKSDVSANAIESSSE